MRKTKIRIVVAVLMAVFLSTDPAHGQKVELDLNDVPRDYRSTVIDAVNKGKDKTSTPETVQKWVGIGKEVGAAMNAGLGAVVDNAEKFGKSDVGKYTMWLIMWRLFGRDLFNTGLVAVLVAAALAILVWSYRRSCLPRRVLKSNINGAKTWEIMPPSIEDPGDRGGTMFVHGVVFVLVLLIGGCNMMGVKF